MITRQQSPIGNYTNGHVAGAAGAAAEKVIAAIAKFRHVLHGCQVSYDDAPTGGKLTVKSAATVIFEIDLTAEGFYNLESVLTSAVGESLTITLAAPGGAVVGKLNYQVITEMIG